MTNLNIYANRQIIDNLYENILEKINKKNNLDFYQYTTIAGLNGMLKSGCLWATNIKFLNDSSEFNIGKNIILDTLDCLEIKKIVNDAFENSSVYADKLMPYTVSFCGNGDLLSQWITYAKEGGVSIEFDFPENNKLFYSCKSENNAYKYLYFSSKNILPRPVIYVQDHKNKASFQSTEEEKNQLHLFLDTLKNYLINNNSNKENDNWRLQAIVRAAVCYIKNIAFKAENESRLVVFPIEQSLSNTATEIKHFLTDKQILRPYVEIYFNNKNLGLPIKSITVGPSGNQDIIFQSLISRICNGLDNETKIWIIDQNSKREKQYYRDFFKQLENDKVWNNFCDEIEVSASLFSPEKLSEEIFKYEGLKEKVNKTNKFKDYQKKCYFCENRKITIRKSKIPYIF